MDPYASLVRARERWRAAAVLGSSLAIVGGLVLFGGVGCLFPPALSANQGLQATTRLLWDHDADLARAVLVADPGLHSELGRLAADTVARDESTPIDQRADAAVGLAQADFRQWPAMLVVIIAASGDRDNDAVLDRLLDSIPRLATPAQDQLVGRALAVLGTAGRADGVARLTHDLAAQTER